MRPAVRRLQFRLEMMEAELRLRQARALAARGDFRGAETELLQAVRLYEQARTLADDENAAIGRLQERLAGTIRQVRDEALRTEELIDRLLAAHRAVLGEEPHSAGAPAGDKSGDLPEGEEPVTEVETDAEREAVRC
jgi:hypothetical protein